MKPMKPRHARAYVKALSSMDDLNLLMVMEIFGLYDLIRCPEGVVFYWRTTVQLPLAIPLEQEFKKREHLHAMLSFVRDYHEYAPCPTHP